MMGRLSFSPLEMLTGLVATVHFCIDASQKRRYNSTQMFGAGQEFFEEAARRMISSYANAISQMMESLDVFNPFSPFAPRDKRIDRSA